MEKKLVKISLITKTLLLLFSVISCSLEKDELVLESSISKSLIPMIVTISGDANNSSLAIYDIDGNFLKYVANYRSYNGTPMGLVASNDTDNFIVSLNGADQLLTTTVNGNTSIFYGSNSLNGAIFDIEKDSLGSFYVVESNNIEKFDSQGARIPLTGNAFVTGSVGSCVLNAPRNMYMTSDDKLIIANINGTDQIVTLDVSDNQVSCLSSVNFGNNPYDVVLHSDSHLYVVTQNDDRVYQADSDGSNATVIWDTDLTIIRDPTAIVELPNGNLLVASSFTDSIEQIQTDGTRVGTSPFIMDSFSVNVQDMIIVYGEAP